MALSDIIEAIGNNPVAEFVQVNQYAFPVLEAAHVVAIMLVVGSIFMLDLRLVGVSSRNHAVTRLSAEVLPWTWTAFAVAAVTGALLFTSQAGAYAQNLQFQLKLALMAAAGLNMLLFHFITWRSVDAWNTATPTPPAAKLAGLLSLVFWIGVVVCGRWVGWTVSAAPF
ncbi:MAG: hypothetical protein B7Y99_04930 [Caulobacterales bacterium 32-69-10]|nr:MAG: hypothetical protein B7Y99_04930 [Caulobacterales bacterium 32-69-10]